MVFNGLQGILGFFVNGQYKGAIHSPEFQTGVFYPAVAVQGDNEKMVLTYVTKRDFDKQNYLSKLNIN